MTETSPPGDSSTTRPSGATAATGSAGPAGTSSASGPTGVTGTPGATTPSGATTPPGATTPSGAATPSGATDPPGALLTATTPGSAPFGRPLPDDLRRPELPGGLLPLLPVGWPRPVPAPPTWLWPAAGVAGLLAAILLPGAERPGLQLLLCAIAAVAPVAALGWRRLDAGDRALVLLGVGLTGVAAVRASEWLAVFCAFVGAALAVVVATGARRWWTFPFAGPALALAVARALPWAARRPAPGAVRRAGAWVRGAASGVAAALVVGGLLASGDAAFGTVVDAVLPSVRLDLGLLPARVVVGGGVLLAVLGAAYAVAAGTTWRVLPERPATGPVTTWLSPLVSVAVVIAAFLTVEAAMLFGGHEVVLRGTGVSYADRARQGFGQLTAVTLIVLALLAWASHRARGERERRTFALAGGPLAGLTMVLVVSALRRMWLYQDAYGWTVLRILVSVFELWIGALIVVVCVAWVLRRTAGLPRLTVGSGAAVLLVLALAGPDALAARADVARFERTGKIDVDYLASLSADAVPALQRLPEPERSCALALQEVTTDPWYGANLARARAAASLRERPPLPVSCPR